MLYYARWTHSQSSAVVDTSLGLIGLWNVADPNQFMAFGTTPLFDQVRCALPYLRGSGCVFATHPAYFPIGAYDPDVTQSALFIQDAQKGLPGNPGRWHSTPMTRIDTSSSQYTANVAAKD